jgi:hypothetical protein
MSYFSMARERNHAHFALTCLYIVFATGLHLLCHAGRIVGNAKSSPKLPTQLSFAVNESSRYHPDSLLLKLLKFTLNLTILDLC